MSMKARFFRTLRGMFSLPLRMFRCTCRFDLETEQYKEGLLMLEAARDTDEQPESQLTAIEPECISEGEDGDG